METFPRAPRARLTPRSNRSLAALTVVSLLLTAPVLSGCSLIDRIGQTGGLSDEELARDEQERSRIVAAVEAAVSDVTSIDVVWNTQGFDDDLGISIVRTTTAPLTARELRGVLEGAWDGAHRAPKWVSLRVFAAGEGTDQAILFDAAADELGDGWHRFGGGAKWDASSMVALFGTKPTP